MVNKFRDKVKDPEVYADLKEHCDKFLSEKALKGLNHPHHTQRSSQSMEFVELFVRKLQADALP